MSIESEANQQLDEAKEAQMKQSNLVERLQVSNYNLKKYQKNFQSISKCLNTSAYHTFI